MNLKLFYAAVTMVSVVCSMSFAQAPPGADNGGERKKFGHTLKQPKGESRTIGPAEAQKKESDEDDVIRVDSFLVLADVQVSDKQGRPIGGLKHGDFIVTEDGKPQEITTFALGDDPGKPRSIILIIDSSSSQLPYIDTSVEAAKTMVDKLGPRDKIAIVTDDITLTVNFTQDKEKLKKTLESLKKSGYSRFGASRQFSALMAALKELVVKDERTLIIFQTDGDELRALLPSVVDNRRQTNVRDAGFSVADIYKEAENSGATIYPVIPGFRLTGLSRTELLSQTKKDIGRRIDSGEQPKVFFKSFARKDITNDELFKYAQGPLQLQLALESLGRITGGEAFNLEELKDAPEIYSRILSDINHRYAIGYQSTNTERDGKRRKIKIAVRNHPEYTVKGRTGYYAPSGSK